MPQFCASCGTQMADGAAVCPGCGKATSGAAAATAAAPAAGGLQDNVAGMLAYFTIIPAIIFLVMEPYNRNKFIRFHAFQCLFMAAVYVAAQIICTVIPLFWVILPFLYLGFVILWILLVVKAYGGQKFKLPIIGDLAEKQA
jgi:uncharacterized membrane protein